MSLRRQLIKSGKIKRTKTTTFLLPIFPYYKSLLNSVYFIDAYIHSVAKPSLIVVLQDIEENEDNSKLVEAINGCVMDPGYVSCSNGDKEILIEFRVPKRYLLDFQTFLEGKYSKLSLELKEILMSSRIEAQRKLGHKEEDARKIANSTGTGSKVTMYDILYPTARRRREVAADLLVREEVLPDDIFDIPSLNNERYYTIEELKNKYESTTTAIQG